MHFFQPWAILYSEPEGLNTKKELPKVEKSAFKKGVYY